MNGRAHRLIIGTVVSLLAAVSSFAQPVLVRTVARTAKQETVAAYLHVVDEESVTPGLSLDTATGAPQLWAHPKSGLVVAGDTLVDLMTWQIAMRPGQEEPAWHIVDARFTPDPVLLEHSPDGGADRLRVIHAGDEPNGNQQRWLLPGRAIAMDLLTTSQVVVLCVTEDGRTVLHTREIPTGRVIMEAHLLRVPENTRPTGLAVSHSHERVIALMTQRTDSKQTTLVQMLTPDTFLPLAEPAGIPGEPAPTGAVSVIPNGCWISTWEPGTGFAYATRLQFSEDHAKVDVSQSYTGMQTPPRIAVSPKGKRAAIAVGNRVELCVGTTPRGTVADFHYPVSALAWTGGRLVAGEGPYLHRFETKTFTTENTTMLDTGVISGIAPFPSILSPLFLPQPAAERAAAETPVSADPIQRVLWLVGRGATGRTLRGTDDALGLRKLADMLAGPPLHLSHRVSGDPAGVDALRQSTLVVLTTSAAADGLVTRSDILDYIAQGGALLLINDMTENDDRAPNRWFAPAGLHFDPDTPLAGRVEATVDHPVTRHWSGVVLTGPALKVDSPETAIATTANGEAGLAALEHGQGRIVALAAPGPLQSGSLNRAFARDAVAWLRETRPAARDEDSDDDGLPDAAEDANGNGRVDANETDPNKRDTDGDGLPDPADPKPLTPQP